MVRRDSTQDLDPIPRNLNDFPSALLVPITQQSTRRSRQNVSKLESEISVSAVQYDSNGVRFVSRAASFPCAGVQPSRATPFISRHDSTPFLVLDAAALCLKRLAASSPLLAEVVCSKTLDERSRHSVGCLSGRWLRLPTSATRLSAA